MSSILYRSVAWVGLIFTVSILGSCTNKIEELEIAPSLLPSPIPMVTSPSINEEYVNTLPKSNPNKVESSELELFHGMKLSNIPVDVQDVWGIYPMHNGDGYIIVDRKEDTLPDAVIEDIKEFLSDLRPAYRTHGESGDISSMAIRLAWLEEAYSRIYDNTGWIPVVVHEVLTHAISDAEESAVYSYWVKESDRVIHSTAYPTIEEALQEAEDWIDNEGSSTQKYILLISSMGSPE